MSNDLSIVIESSITSTNFGEWKEPLLAAISAANRTLESDQDFATAETDVTALKASEDALKVAKKAALKKAEDVFKLFSEIDDVTESARQARLALSKQIKARKEQIKNDAVVDATAKLKACLDGLTPELINHEGPQLLKQGVAHLEDAVKGKRTVESMHKAIGAVMGVFESKFKQRNEAVIVNLEVLDAYAQNNPALFTDKDALACTQDLEQLKKTIQARLLKYKAQEEAKQKAAEAQENELKLRRQIDAEKQRAEPETQQELPAPMAGLKDTISQESAARSDVPSDTYQITIIITQTHSAAVTLAKGIKADYGEVIDQIKMHKLKNEQTA